MKKHYPSLSLLFIAFIFVVFSCSKSEDPIYIPVAPVSPVTVDLTKVPYEKLSEYQFFEGELKDQIPALDVLPFEPASSLFTDYAQKKRFVWIPKGKKATYKTDGTVLELPVGSALIKTFYYNKVQPSNTTRIIETRVMIRKSTGWIFANYVWNEDQTEAINDLNGSFTPIEWKNDNNVIKSTNYRIPSEEQCIVCHKITQTVNGVDAAINVPIGIKPQNLNTNYNYDTGAKNQLTAWIEKGYLENNFSLPTSENSTVDYNDASKSLDARARSYVDINCAHCHQDNRICYYRPMRFAFNETAGNRTNMGVCVNTADMQGFSPSLGKIVTPGNKNRSMMYYRLNTTNPTYRMPLHGRTVIHDEGIALIEAWINSLAPCN